MKTRELAAMRRALVAACALVNFAPGLALAETNGFVPNSPTLWCKFDGDTRDYGTAKTKWTLKNVPQQANAIYLNGIYGQPYLAGKPNPNDEGGRATCQMPVCSRERYTVALRFKRDAGRDCRNVLTYGYSMRWLSIQPSPMGGLDLNFNNNEYILPLAGVELRADDWNWVVVAVDVPARTCTAFLNGKSAAPMKLPADFTLHEPPARNFLPGTPDERDASWTFTNGSNAKCFAGWVDELLVYSRALNPAELAGLAQRKEMLDPKLPETKRPSPTELQPANVAAVAAAEAARLSPADLQERPGTLSINSVGSPYSIAARMSGTLSWNAKKVKVHIAKGEILRQNKGISPQRAIIGYRLYVRRENPQLKWMDMVGKSELMPIELSITHGTQVAFEDTDVEIPLPAVPAAELGQMWVGMLIFDSSEKVDAQTGERERSEGTCVAEMSIRLNGQAAPSAMVAPK